MAPGRALPATGWLPIALLLVAASPGASQDLQLDALFETRELMLLPSSDSAFVEYVAKELAIAQTRVGTPRFLLRRFWLESRSKASTFVLVLSRRPPDAAISAAEQELRSLRPSAKLGLPPELLAARYWLLVDDAKQTPVLLASGPCSIFGRHHLVIATALSPDASDQLWGALRSGTGHPRLFVERVISGLRAPVPARVRIDLNRIRAFTNGRSIWRPGDLPGALREAEVEGALTIETDEPQRAMDAFRVIASKLEWLLFDDAVAVRVGTALRAEDVSGVDLRQLVPKPHVLASTIRLDLGTGSADVARLVTEVPLGVLSASASVPTVSWLDDETSRFEAIEFARRWIDVVPMGLVAADFDEILDRVVVRARSVAGPGDAWMQEIVLDADWLESGDVPARLSHPRQSGGGGDNARDYEVEVRWQLADGREIVEPRHATRRDLIALRPPWHWRHVQIELSDGEGSVSFPESLRRVHVHLFGRLSGRERAGRSVTLDSERRSTWARVAVTDRERPLEVETLWRFRDEVRRMPRASVHGDFVLLETPGTPGNETVPPPGSPAATLGSTHSPPREGPSRSKMR